MALNSIMYWGRGKKVCVKKGIPKAEEKRTHTVLNSHRTMRWGMCNYNEIIRIIFELLNFSDEVAKTENVLRASDGTYNLHIKFSG